MLELQKVTKIYKTKAGDTAALNGLSLVLPDSGMVFITGRSGSGKTTLLNVVGGLDGIDGGDIIVDGKKFSEFTSQNDCDYRNTFVGFVFQEYNLLPDYTIEKNIRIANELQGKETTTEEVDEVLKLVDLAGLNNRMPSQLSGGQKQRVAIARALIKNPKIIMADEPTGALDQATGIQVMEALKKLSKEKLVVVVSHDMEMAERYADRIVRLVDGRLAEDVTLSDEEITFNLIDNEDGLTVKNGADLNEGETATLVKAIREKRNIVFANDISGRQKSPTPEITAVHPEKPVDFVSSKMKMKSSMGLGVRSLTVKPLRLIFTVLLSVVAFALFGLFDTIGAYDNARIMANLLKTGDYNSVTINTQYVESFGEESIVTSVRAKQATIDKLNSDTGFSFRPLYEVNDKRPRGISTTVTVKSPDEKDFNNADFIQGISYYTTHVDDFVEFKKSEIEGNVIDKNGYNLKILYGRYPTLDYERDFEGNYANVDADGNPYHVAKDFAEIAISSHLAESLLHWAKLNKLTFYGDKENGQVIKEYEAVKIDSIADFAEDNFVISLNNDYTVLKLWEGQNQELGERSGLYKITGIIDCGKIPEKFEELKESPSRNSVLATNFNTWLDSGLYRKIFVSENYVKEWREFNQRQVRYFGAGKDQGVTYKLAGKDFTGRSTTSFYRASEFSTANVILFKDLGATDSPVTDNTLNPTPISLSKNQVIIAARDIRNIYEDEYASTVPDKKTQLNSALSLLNDSNMITYTQRVESLRKVRDIFSFSGKMLARSIDVEMLNPYSNNDPKEQLEIVGVYFNVDADIDGNNNQVTSYKPLMLADDMLTTLNVSLEQGEYARMTSVINKGYFSTKSLSSYMANNDGLKTPWYNNAVLEQVEDNREQMRQFSDLFLYLSLVLAAFSIFMLFNYITTSIVSRHQAIGVLRALGSNSKDIFMIFFTESLIIALVNGLLACGVAAIGCIFVNLYIQQIMNLAISFAIFSIRQILIIFGMSLLTSIISSAIPIIKICKEKPVDLIRRP